MNNIHKTAIVSKNAIVGENVTIGAYSVIGDNVKIANNNIIYSSVYIDGHTDISENNKFFPFCSDKCSKIDLFRWLDNRYVISKDIDFDN